jgi:hypothetical protein
MATRATDLQLDDPGLTEAWLKSFAALSRTKGLKDTEEEGNKVTDLFLSRVGVEALRKITLMAQPKDVEKMPFKEIQQLIVDNIRPKKKITIAERTKFLSMKQEPGESVQVYSRRLRDGARFCDFSSLNSATAAQTAEDELILMRLIDGLASHEHMMKVLEHMQAKSLTLDETIQYIQQLEAIGEFGRRQDCKPSVAPSASSIERAMGVSHVKQKNLENKSCCKYCGRRHAPARCPAFGKKCNSCGRKNHFAIVCQSKQVKSANEIQADSVSCEDDVADVFVMTAPGKKTMKDVIIDGCSLLMQIDTGSDATIVPNNFWRKMGCPELNKSHVKLRQFDGSVIKTRGEFQALIEVDGKYSTAKVIVSECSKPHGLLGTNVVSFRSEALQVHEASGEKASVGVLKKFKARIQLANNYSPSFFHARSLPIHMKPLVVAQLEKMIKDGILEKVPPGGSKWASPITIVRKPNGDLRICSDYKATVNPKICSDSYPLPSTETAFCELANMSYFAKIDLKNAYNQIQIDEDSKEILTINTPIGLLRWTRLPYGVKTASAIFQAAMEETLGGRIKNMLIYQDDICIGAISEKELKDKVKMVMKILTEAGMTVNEEKCVFKSKEINFLGFCISAEGVRPDTKLVEKIKGVKRPMTKRDLESFLGIVNFYGRHLSRFSDRVAPLNELRGRNVPFEWKEEQQKAFDKLKEALSCYPLVRLFDPAKTTVLTTDASEKAISAVLSQDGHPVIYLSRSLNDAEKKYANIEREALAIVWATNRARQFLLGKKFILQSDHQPLEIIFHPSKELPKVTSARLLRWAIQLSAFDYEIQYVKGNTIPHVDALSRLDFDPEGMLQAEESKEEACIHWNKTDLFSMQEVKDETQRDPVLRGIFERISKNRWSNCSPAERPFKAKRQTLSVEDGVLCTGDQAVLPPTLRAKILAAAHNDIHCGTLATRNRLRLEAWWPGYCNDVDNFVKACSKCAVLKPEVRKFTHAWPEASKAWERVHMDHGLISGIGLVLILVDSYSGWPEVVRVRDRRAETVMMVLREVFSRNGVPNVLVSDNAAEFGDEKLKAWLDKVGCKQIKTPPYHPASNGIAERMVQTIKRGVKAYTSHCGSFDSYLAKLLLSYRAIPHADRSQSPSFLMGRQIRSPLTMSFTSDSPVLYSPLPDSTPEEARFVVQAGRNTAIIVRGEEERPTLAHRDQLRRDRSNEEVSLEEKCSRSVAAPPLVGTDEPVQDQTPPMGSETSSAVLPPPFVGMDSKVERRVSQRSNKGIPPERFSAGV